VQLLFATVLDRLDHPSPLPPRDAALLALPPPAAPTLRLALPAPTDPTPEQQQQQQQQQPDHEPAAEDPPPAAAEEKEKERAAAAASGLSQPPADAGSSAYLDDLLWLLDEPPASAEVGGVQQQHPAPIAAAAAATAGSGHPASPPARHADMGLWAVLEEMWWEPFDGEEAAAAAAPAGGAAGVEDPGISQHQLLNDAAEAPVEDRALVVSQQQQQPTDHNGGLDDDWLFHADEHEEEERRLQLAAAEARAALEEVATTSGVLYALHCLYHTQLAVPKVSIYTPLPLLQLLASRVAALEPAGAGDAAVVLRSLLQSGALVAGAVRRPAPRVALHGAEIAGASGRRGGADGATATWAVAPQVQREVLFHIKAALKGLANFKRLQVLCDEYAAVRAAVFGPLGMQPTAAEQQQQQQQQRSAPGPAAAFTLPSWAMGESGARRLSQQKRVDGLSAAAVAADTAGEAQDTGQTAAEQQPPPPRLTERERPPTELFDSSFGASLQQLAVAEAAALLGALQPAPQPGRSRRRRKRRQQPAESAELLQAQREGAEDAAQQRRRLEGEQSDGTRVLTGMAARLYSGRGRRPEAPPAATRRSQQQQQQQGGGPAAQRRASPQPPPPLIHTADLAAVGLKPPAAPAAANGSGGQGTMALTAPGLLISSRGAALALAVREQRAQQAMQIAESWFAAHDRLMAGQPVAFEQDVAAAAAVGDGMDTDDDDDYDDYDDDADADADDPVEFTTPSSAAARRGGRRRGSTAGGGGVGGGTDTRGRGGRGGRGRAARG